MDAPRGFEPRLTESESVVLPLDDRAARGERLSRVQGQVKGRWQPVMQSICSAACPASRIALAWLSGTWPARAGIRTRKNMSMADLPPPESPRKVARQSDQVEERGQSRTPDPNSQRSRASGNRQDGWGGAPPQWRQDNSSQNPRNVPPHRNSYAAIDLGTNNCRLLIARPAGENFTVIDAFSRVVRLGEGLAQTGRLSRGSDGPRGWCAEDLFGQAQAPQCPSRAIRRHRSLPSGGQRGGIHRPGSIAKPASSST